MRGASTATTLGVANPFISLVEDVAAIVGSLLALFVPFVGALLALALTLLVVFVARHLYLELRRSAAAA